MEAKRQSKEGERKRKTTWDLPHTLTMSQQHKNYKSKILVWHVLSIVTRAVS